MALAKEPIAIIGSACRFPGGASSPSKLWDLLKEPRDVLSEFSKDRLALSNFYNSNPDFHGSTNVQNKSYLLSEEVGLFDAGFFHINAVEAEGMDPAQRILLETVYEAMEAAGVADRVRGSQTSVFVGLMTADWADIQMRDTETLPTYAATGTARSIASNRISYLFDLRGASMTIDTACSSSLVALHQAVQSLRNSESTTAIVAGANLILDPTIYISESKLHMLSPDSRSRMWDASANGYARGEGTAALILKPLSRAIADGDQIETIIRETGVNSDGRTPGITMPSPDAQADLIRSTYRAAGLDPAVDRCQYFECHGTGTQAGDPIEAQAIAKAFFPESQKQAQSEEDKLYVGSIKTIIGHLEGCSGLAGVLKASLAIQKKMLPPNLLFKELNPAVAPYTKNLELVQKAMPWPATTSECRRASINSFGFGGTNAHAILESYEPPDEKPPREEPDTPDCLGPLVFSAGSFPSLVNMVREYSGYIKSNLSVDLNDLAWTLQTKRELMSFKQYFSGSTREDVCRNMDVFVSDHTNDGVDESASSPNEAPFSDDEPPAILGVFTGQGAQWATMGASLIRQSHVFRQSIERCEAALAALPDPPSWSLKAELLAPEESSRLKEALIAQPLCTAIQIATVDLASAAGIRFDVTVGHSSGEIAAAYAAGIISADHATAIAYYRGYHSSKLAQSPDGLKGAMMAVSVSFDTAADLCSQPDWAGRISVAASNAPTSVTLSGDVTAVDQAKAYFDEKGIFARRLLVDTAYHSHHMLPCADAYLQSLKALNITVNQPRPGCTWCSSVLGDAVIEGDDLQALAGQYWVDNMVKPVLFAEAVETSIWNGGPFTLAMEVGPHQALKGPTTQVIKSILDSAPPYTSFLHRAKDAVGSFSEAVGQVWSALGPSSLDLGGYRGAFFNSSPRILKGLPSYPWDHRRRYWREGRISRNYRLRSTTPHELLGRRVPDDTEHEMRWRNILRLGEVPWLRGHKFQGQVLYPAAAHVVQALEASRYLASGRQAKLIKLQDVRIHHSIVLQESSPGVETTFTLKLLGDGGLLDDADVVEAEFYSMEFSEETGSGSPRKTASGRLVLYYGDSYDGGLPAVEEQIESSSMSEVKIDTFYACTQGLGLEYHDAFRGLVRAHRTKDTAKVVAACSGGRDASSKSNSSSSSSSSTHYLVHPVLLDLAFQSNLVPLVSSASGTISQLYLPTTFDSVIVDPSRLVGFSVPGAAANMESFVTQISSSSMTGDIHVRAATDSSSASIQVEGLGWKALSNATAANDRLLFSKTVWELDVADGLVDCNDDSSFDGDELIFAMERSALFYFQDLIRNVARQDVATFASHHQRLFEAVEAKLDEVRAGKAAVAQQDWLCDSRQTVDDLKAKFPQSIELELMSAINQELLSVVRGETQILEVMLQNNMLNRFYLDGAYAVRLNSYIAAVAKQLSRKHPRANVLEIGAGTGGTTRSILDSIGRDGYSSYTYTDVSSGFFQKAADKFADHRDKMVFKVLDVEKPVAAQGYQEAAYDVIFAANVLHATRVLSETVRHARSLLKPGGFLVLMEITGDSLMATYTMGALPGWWLGVDDGRRFNPGVSVSEWDTLLKGTGFSGVDKVAYDCPDLAKHTFSVLISQAVDEQVNLVREPLSASTIALPQERLLIIGGAEQLSEQLSRQLQLLLRRQWSQITVAPSLDALEIDSLDQNTVVISLTELDTPFFSSSTITDERLARLQQLFSRVRKILWMTNGAMGRDPLSNMVVGLARSLPKELPHLALQFLDMVDSAAEEGTLPVTIAKALLRLVVLARSEPAKRGPFYAIEPELRLEKGRLMIPRIVLDQAMNQRFNAKRRLVTHTLHTKSTPIEVVANPERQGLVLQDAAPLQHALEGGDVIDVQYSTGIGKGLFLAVGSTRATPSRLVLALSDTARSSMRPAPERTFVLADQTLHKENLSPSALLLQTAGHAIASSVLRLVPRGAAALVHGATASVAAAIQSLSQTTDQQVFFSRSSFEKKPEAPGWIHVHPHATKRALRAAITPCKVRCLIVFGQPSLEAEALASSLPFDSSVHYLNQDTTVPVDRGLLLEAIYTHALSSCSLNEPVPNTVDVRTVPEMGCGTINYPTILDWTRSSEMTVAVRQLSPGQSIRPDRSYLLVGMTGDLGLSICKWMITNGARYIALASRSAEVDRSWLQEMAALGASVQVHKMDVTDRSSVQRVLADIKATLPPIAGVCNAAMVLDDKLFVDMTAESLNKVLGPKVQGSRLLDDMFGDELDFMVFFSSLASVFGNAGQSNYHAANLFMQGLCARRRARGLAASVMHVGFVTDVGYVARSGRRFKNHMGRLSLQFMSEGDLHHLFAEAVVNSRPGSSGSWDIIAGIDPFVEGVGATASDRLRPPFYANPQFAYFIRQQTDASTVAAAGEQVAGSGGEDVKRLLGETKSEQDAISLVQNAFVKELEAMLQMVPNTVKSERSLMSLGLDSLIAVEIRHWFQRIFDLDVSVLSILKYNSVADICTDLTRKHFSLRAI
ncbi:uncharacterized protein PpBr36_10625 [Pyricularia pennisetigena]|uniref:uncharacterized protein n=1 Tax=Pyricularia pennisetigena TaxID=1578925 RepID=UPI0011514201|nr:uncharacterized protein PpBr36_10625 [Pyricularia pennisetigena]TLS21086.1 hypothetical protein PpBr36_10625 [Pyricularia pennisetigena]